MHLTAADRPAPGPRRDVVVVGASAGGMSALQRIVARLPAALPASVLVVTHLAPAAPSRLPTILGKATALPVSAAEDGQPMKPGHVYTAVPDRHLLIGAHDVLRLSRGPRENRVRPAVDALFRSAARWCGPRVIGVVLSGTLDDGAAGLAAIVESGGAALVQRPAEARFAGMPRAALTAVPGAEELPATQLARRIAELVDQPVPPIAAEPGESLIWETDMNEHGRSAARQSGRPVGLGCPECGGGMHAVETGKAVHYVCHAGHSYSPQTLLAARDDGIERALWTALSALQEKAMVLADQAARAGDGGDPEVQRRQRADAERTRHAADLLREQILGGTDFWEPAGPGPSGVD
jgi:two-component system, chemotaxis family, protein-glutamate methylesterase/glutaminase